MKLCLLFFLATTSFAVGMIAGAVLLFWTEWRAREIEDHDELDFRGFQDSLAGFDQELPRENPEPPSKQ